MIITDPLIVKPVYSYITCVSLNKIGEQELRQAGHYTPVPSNKVVAHKLAPV